MNNKRTCPGEVRSPCGGLLAVSEDDWAFAYFSRHHRPDWRPQTGRACLCCFGVVCGGVEFFPSSVFLYERLWKNNHWQLPEQHLRIEQRRSGVRLWLMDVMMFNKPLCGAETLRSTHQQDTFVFALRHKQISQYLCSAISAHQTAGLLSTPHSPAVPSRRSKSDPKEGSSTDRLTNLEALILFPAGLKLLQLLTAPSLTRS